MARATKVWLGLPDFDSQLIAVQQCKLDPAFNVCFLSWTEELAGTCTHDRHALQQLALNVHVKHSDLTWPDLTLMGTVMRAPCDTNTILTQSKQFSVQ